jgi:BirA family biotin operon repressor/biotin-[acetyl-CoA-carboxylase] ligase
MGRNDLPEWLAGLDRPCRYYTRTGSTNSEAFAWALAGAPDGAIVLADEQTAGRGRLGRTWLAEPGSSLLFSVILRPALAPEMLGRVPLLGAVALAECLEGLGLAARIKWPNDVQIEGRKVSGILAEAVWQGERLAGVVLGIGVNVRRAALSQAQARALGAITIEEALGQALDRGRLLRDLRDCRDAWLPRAGDAALLAAWRSRAGMLGRPVTVQQGERMLTGIAQDIDEQGALLVRDAQGTLHRLLAGDVSLRENGLA